MQMSLRSNRATVEILYYIEPFQRLDVIAPVTERCAIRPAETAVLRVYVRECSSRSVP